jgi:hypothetical protein
MIRDPGTRPKSFQGQITWHLEEEVADKEDACTEAVSLGIDAYRLVHLQCGKADVDPIDVADEIRKQQERHQTP